MRAVYSITAYCLASLLSFCLISSVTAQDEKNIPSTTLQAVDLKRTEERYRIGFQDTLEVTVAKHPDFSATVNVAPDGTIILPRIEEPISVVCKTERELANEIALQLKKTLKNPYVNVRAIEQRSQSFAVIGAVQKPGLFYINRKLSLLELLTFAGGHDTDKAGTKLIVARTGSNSTCKQFGENVANTQDQDFELYQFTIRNVLQGKENLWMQPGDIVSVLDADVVYVYGNVNKQGSIKLTRPITLRQAIVSAEGFAPSSKKDKIKILRQKEGSVEWDEIIFNLKDIDSGKVQDPILQPNDIVAVSEDSVKSILRTLGKSVTGGIPSLFYRIP